jgi:2-polyprenyl-3-methyl-5-hydroxy-6-metoxy-1,4-benzoquinol methylase
MKTAKAEAVACLYCGSNRAMHWDDHVSQADHRSYEIFKCRACESAFVNPPPSSEYLTEFYGGALNSHGGQLLAADVQEHYREILRREDAFPNSTLDAERIARNARDHAKGDEFLDIGAGYGFFTKAAVAAGFRCTAIEANDNNCQVFEKMNGFRPLQAMFDADLAAAHAGRFDVVLLSQVLEHLPHPRTVVRLLASVLKPGGLCIIAVPHFGSYLSRIQGRRDMFVAPPEHINFFSIAGLRNLFEAESMACIDLHTVSRFDHHRLRSRLRLTPLAAAASGVLSAFLSFSDNQERGMFINAYFRQAGP